VNDWNLPVQCPSFGDHHLDEAAAGALLVQPDTDGGHAHEPPGAWHIAHCALHKQIPVIITGIIQNIIEIVLYSLI
jgi:hypothetical protein